jgi:hypothetical protein
MANGPDKVTDVSQTPNAGKLSVAVRLRGISSVGREGNSPDRRLRPLSVCSVGKDVELLRQPGGWLRSSHP